MKGANAIQNQFRRSSADQSPEHEPSFILRRRKTNKSSARDDSEPVSPRFGATPLSGSNKSNLEIQTTSATSSLSLGSKFPQNVSDWNEKVQREINTHSAEYQPRHAADPPRPAREGYEWVWFPEGYWAEREGPVSSLKEKKSRKWFSKSTDRENSSSSPPSKSQMGNRTLTDVEIPQIKIGSDKSHSSSSRDSQAVEDRSVGSGETETPSSRIKKGLQYVSPTHPHFTSPSGQPEGLYCKVKRKLEPQITDKEQMYLDDSSEIATVFGHPSRTTLLLEGTSNYFNRQQREQRDSNCTNRTYLTPATPQTPASTDSRVRRGFGLAPWHRKTSQESILSVSSSVHRLLMGRAPAATPAPERQNCDPHDDRVEISEPGQPNFLPSEARRIQTPPLSRDTSSSGCQPQGFFFEISPSTDEEVPEKDSPLRLSAETYPPKRLRTTTSQPSQDWWDASNPARKAAATGLAKQKQLEVDMSLPPEHLPSSPLCPKNPMYKSKGRGICVYHGRRRNTNLRSADGEDSAGYSPSHFGLYQR